MKFFSSEMQGNAGKKTLITAENDIYQKILVLADNLFSSEKALKQDM
jgi:hypothetical protein